MASRNEDVHQDYGSDASSDEDYDYYSDGGETFFVELNEYVLSRVRRNDPDVTHLRITDATSNFIHEIDWEDYEGNVWGGNDQLKKLEIAAENYMPNTFWMGVGRNRSIDSLTISERALNPTPHISVFTGMSALFVNNNNLCHISFDSCDIGEEHVRLLAASLMKRHNKQSLRKIEITNCAYIVDEEQAIGELVVALEGYINLVKVSMESSGFGGRTAYFALANILQNPICKLGKLKLCESSSIDDDCCAIFGAALSKNKSLEYLDISETRMDVIGAKSLTACLQVNSMLKMLVLSACNIEDQAAAALGSALANNSTLISLEFNRNDSITSVGWRAFSVCLENPNSVLKRLAIYRCNIDNEGVTTLGNALANNSVLKILDMAFNNANSVGWGAFSVCLRSPGSKLEDLDVQGDNCNDDTVVIFASALVGNTRLRCLNVANGNILTSRSCDALENLLCNKTSIEAIYTSNHSLRTVIFNDHLETNDLAINLDMNGNRDKAEVARQKIIQYHFMNGEDNMEDFVAMEICILPRVISWIGKNDIGRSLLYKLFQCMPTVFDTKNNAKAAGVKRKRMGGSSNESG